MWIEVLAAAAAVGAGVTAGVLFCVAISLVPGFLALPPGSYVEAHKLFGRYFDRTMPPIVIATTVLNVVLAVAVGDATRRALFVTAAACLLGVSLVSQLRNVPINRTVKRLSGERLPADWEDTRPTWRDWHLRRTGLSLAALVATAVAAAL